MAIRSKRVYFKENIMIRSLDEPVTTPDYSFPLAMIEMKIDRMISIMHKLVEILEVGKNDKN